MNTIPQQPTLVDLIGLASDLVEKMFNTNGELAPMYFAATLEQCMLVPLPMPLDRSDGNKLVSDLFHAKGVFAYVFADEMWIAVEQHSDRQEALVLSAESEREPTIFGIRRIMRPTDGPAYLGPLEIETPRSLENVDSALFGLGLLRRRTTLQ